MPTHPIEAGEVFFAVVVPTEDLAKLGARFRDPRQKRTIEFLGRMAREKLVDLSESLAIVTVDDEGAWLMGFVGGNCDLERLDEFIARGSLVDHWFCATDTNDHAYH